MKFKCIYLLLFLGFISCETSIQDEQKAPEKVPQWINPIVYNTDFETELNFPIWFDDSLVKAHKIYKITKRIFKNISQDSNLVNRIPNEKIEYYFDPNGLVDQLVVYSYLDDREIARATFVYEKNMNNSGFRQVKALPIKYLSKNLKKDEFSTDFFLDATYQYSIYNSIIKQKKYISYQNKEQKNKLHEINKKKYWGVLSVDSIVKPSEEDWIILGSYKKPFKRYQVENTVNESNVYIYQYWKTGVIKKRIKQIYPFEYRRTFNYDTKNSWSNYIDSTFSENEFISRSIHTIDYDEFQRPIEINHKNENGENQSFTYKETLSYRSKIVK